MVRHLLAAVALAAVAGVVVTTSRHRQTRPARAAIVLPAGQLSLRAVRGGSGPTVVLLHGYGESLVAWQPVFELLASQFDVVALDLPGFGLSSKPPGGYTADSMAAVVLAALDSAGIERAAVVGHSLGGAVAAAMALAEPRRVRALVLLDAALVVKPWMVPDTAAQGLTGDLLREAITVTQQLRARFNPPHAPGWLVRPDSPQTRPLSADPAYHASLEAVLRQFDFEWLSPDRAERLQLPVLVVWGQLDRVFPVSHGRRLAAALGAPLVEIQRSWHRPHVEQPGRTAAVLVPFLNSH